MYALFKKISHLFYECICLYEDTQSILKRKQKQMSKTGTLSTVTDTFHSECNLFESLTFQVSLALHQPFQGFHKQNSP